MELRSPMDSRFPAVISPSPVFVVQAQETELWFPTARAFVPVVQYCPLPELKSILRCPFRYMVSVCVKPFLINPAYLFLLSLVPVGRASSNTKDTAPAVTTVALSEKCAPMLWT